MRPVETLKGENITSKLPSPQCIELVPGDRFRERVRDHKLGRGALYGDSSRLDEFSGEMVLYVDMLGSRVGVRVQHEYERDDERGSKFNTNVFQKTVEPDSLLRRLAHCHML